MRIVRLLFVRVRLPITVIDIYPSTCIPMTHALFERRKKKLNLHKYNLYLQSVESFQVQNNRISPFKVVHAWHQQF